MTSTVFTDVGSLSQEERMALRVLRCCVAPFQAGCSVAGKGLTGAVSEELHKVRRAFRLALDGLASAGLSAPDVRCRGCGEVSRAELDLLEAVSVSQREEALVWSLLKTVCGQSPALTLFVGAVIQLGAWLAVCGCWLRRERAAGSGMGRGRLPSSGARWPGGMTGVVRPVQVPAAGLITLARWRSQDPAGLCVLWPVVQARHRSAVQS